MGYQMTPSRIEDMRAEDVRQNLTHAGLILLAFELVKKLVIVRVKNFYANTAFGEGLPFKTYKDDVLARHKDVFRPAFFIFATTSRRSGPTRWMRFKSYDSIATASHMSFLN